MAERTEYIKASDTHYPEMVSAREAASRTGLSYYIIRKMCLENTIPHIRAGRAFKVNFTAFSEMLNSIQQGDNDGSVRVG